MKKLNVLLVGLIMLLSLSVQAQTAHADYFTGKWKVSLEGTPGGDQTMYIQLARKDGKLLGGIYDIKTGKETIAFDRVEETPKSTTVYFKTQGLDAFLTLDKKDDEHSTGTMMDLFEAKAERLKNDAK